MWPQQLGWPESRDSGDQAVRVSNSEAWGLATPALGMWSREWCGGRRESRRGEGREATP